MLRLILPQELQQTFFLAASHFALRPFLIEREDSLLLLHDMPDLYIAQSLGAGVFPHYERQRLQQLAKRHFRCFNDNERQLILSLAESAAITDAPRGGIFSGPRRLQRITDAISPLLKEEVFDFAGFCRFRLRGHTQYLRYLLNMAADEYLAREEEREYHALLAGIAQPDTGRRSLHIFCSEGDICQLWESGGSGVRHMEGGCFTGREDMLISNLIAAHPTELVIHGARHFPPAAAPLLENVFGSRLHYAAEGEQNQ